jgi:hypothetical protein
VPLLVTCISSLATSGVQLTSFVRIQEPLKNIKNVQSFLGFANYY